MDTILNFSEGHASAPHFISSLSSTDDSRFPLRTVLIIITAFIVAIVGFLEYAGIGPFKIRDKNGNKIPSGPRGIPIFGKCRLY